MSRAKDQFLVFGAMHAPHIGASVHCLSIPEHPYYRERFGWYPEAYPNAQRIGRQAVSLPLSPKLTDSDAEDVVEAVEATLRAGGS